METEKTLLNVQCQLCDEWIAVTYLEDLRHPIRGEMFKSPDPAHGVADPFAAGIGWEDMLCPYGRVHRPFVIEGLIKTDKGMIRVPSNGVNPHIDPQETGAIDRHCIGDRVIMVPEEEAQIRVRMELSKGEPGGKAEERQGKPSDEKPVEGSGEERKGKGKKAAGRDRSSV